QRPVPVRRRQQAHGLFARHHGAQAGGVESGHGPGDPADTQRAGSFAGLAPARAGRPEDEDRDRRRGHPPAGRGGLPVLRAGRLFGGVSADVPIDVLQSPDKRINGPSISGLSEGKRSVPSDEPIAII
ncbi:MAG: hypothetical protein WCI87_09890, partial [Euryarchaeota archaeon]